MLNLILQWAGNVFIVSSVWFIGKKKRWAWILSGIGNAMWLAYAALSHNQVALGVLSGIFIWLAYRNWLMWKGE